MIEELSPKKTCTPNHPTCVPLTGGPCVVTRAYTREVVSRARYPSRLTNIFTILVFFDKLRAYPSVGILLAKTTVAVS